MTNFARRIAAFALTTVTSALLLVAAVGPVPMTAHTAAPVTHSAPAPVGQNLEVMA